MNQTLPVPLYYPSSSSSFPLSPPFPGDVLSIAYDPVFEASMPRGDGINGYHRENNTGQLDGLGRSAYEGVEQKYIQTEVENYRFPTPPATSTRDPLHTFSHQSYLPNPRFDNATYHSAPYPQKSEASAFLDLDLSQPGPSIYRYAETSSAPSMPEELVKIEDAEEAGPDDGDNEEPLYVNAKQYHRILKRRLARQRLEELNRLSRSSKPYLHESRHRHACSRPRGKGGRFLTADEIETLKRDESAKAGMTEREGTIESRLSTSDRSA